jgi:hypothetical protein
MFDGGQAPSVSPNGGTPRSLNIATQVKMRKKGAKILQPKAETLRIEIINQRHE